MPPETLLSSELSIRMKMLSVKTGFPLIRSFKISVRSFLLNVSALVKRNKVDASLTPRSARAQIRR